MNILYLCSGTLLERWKVENIANAGDQVELTSYFGEKVLADGLVITAGPWATQLLKNTDIEIPAEPNRVDVMYWKIKPEYRHQYNVERFPSGLYFIDNHHQEDHHNQEAVYWTPQWEYPDMIKIGFHGNAMVKSNPDRRDENIENDRKRNIEIVSDFIKKSFPGVEFENGPSITETCYYTVFFLSILLLNFHICILDDSRFTFYLGQPSSN